MLENARKAHAASDLSEFVKTASAVVQISHNGWSRFTSSAKAEATENYVKAKINKEI